MMKYLLEFYSMFYTLDRLYSMEKLDGLLVLGDLVSELNPEIWTDHISGDRGLFEECIEIIGANYSLGVRKWDNV